MNPFVLLLTNGVVRNTCLEFPLSEEHKQTSFVSHTWTTGKIIEIVVKNQYALCLAGSQNPQKFEIEPISKQTTYMLMLLWNATWLQRKNLLSQNCSWPASRKKILDMPSCIGCFCFKIFFFAKHRIEKFIGYLVYWILKTFQVGVSVSCLHTPETEPLGFTTTNRWKQEIEYRRWIPGCVGFLSGFFLLSFAFILMTTNIPHVLPSILQLAT